MKTKSLAITDSTRFVSLNISLNHLRLLKVTRDDTVE